MRVSDCGNRDNPLSLDRGMIPEMQTPMLAQALGEALQPTLHNLRYKKLNVFSGRHPPGPDEEEVEFQMFQTSQVMKTWQVSDVEKRRQLIESLRAQHLKLLESSR